MAVAFEPGEPGRFVLSRHKDLPKEKQPVFIVKAMSRRLRRQFMSLVDKAIGLQNQMSEALHKEPFVKDEADKAIDAVQDVYTEMAQFGVIGWENVTNKREDGTEAAVVFSPENLVDYMDVRLDNPDCKELAWNWPDAFKLTDAEKKTSSSVSPNSAT